ncbi:dihydrofolate reductase [Mycoplasma sp. CSL10137]|uniref:dihydrofolate reductase n=1 Tax=unclassified Mycoplasma TaxID=2683645 RepID=UPI00197C2545|nr:MULTISPECIES: dihydrofolate reductase [unclassified Mycoplasma]MBN4083407.1 dihydrofolate reductase [Mycoplasma sp. CSL10137]MBN4084290.1 dihydrofolate reductase [Mycoplasma sp. CSL10166]MBU4692761.1 dihydrofolate reductase [Mycoplasma sp. CSL7491-lung]
MIKLIVALDKNNLIGNKDKLPWRIKEELNHFKTTTLNHSLLFGKNTFLGLPHRLKDRKIYVLSEENIPNADVTINNTSELFKVFEYYKNNSQILFIAGGKSIYESFYNFADELIISRIHGEFSGDVFLNFDLSMYELIETIDKDVFSIEKWVKKI